MVVDYDLSDLPYHQAEVWVCLQADAICGQIMAAQAERMEFSSFSETTSFPPWPGNRRRSSAVFRVSQKCGHLILKRRRV